MHDSTPLAQGLSVDAAAQRLKQDGYNELPRADTRTTLRILIDVLREPMLALLLAGAAIYLLLGDTTEAAILSVFATLSIVITVVQERRTERVLEALRDLSSPRALVIRGGERIRIPGREIVRGDIIVLGEGDRVPADAVVRRDGSLLTDESLLTGESVPVRKSELDQSTALGPVRPGGDDLPVVYSGTLVVRGSGLAEVIATGPRSEIGKIGASLRALKPESPHLQIQMQKAVRTFAVIGIGVSALAVILYGTLRGNWLEALLAGIALGMSMLPEEFPVILTVFMAMGAWRISRARVLTRKGTAIEALGAATVLCTDKTGTLTENRMTVSELRLAGGDIWRRGLSGPLPDAFHTVAAVGLLASSPEPFDPMEKAFHELARALRTPPPGWKLVRTYPLRPDLLAMSQVWQTAGQTLIATKGAPEAVARLCRFDEPTRRAMAAVVDQMGRKGLRVLGVARGVPKADRLPDRQDDLAFEFMGLVGLADPLRDSVPEAVAECQDAGIKVIMITGDYPATARAIAQHAGIASGDVITGPELERLSDDELIERVNLVSVFARILPEQKLRIVQAMKRHGEIVAMTGDGVNDAPSLRAANIGVAMGGRGTDVAREASSIVLLDDDFHSIVVAIRLGRRIYDNIRKALGFVLSIHIPIAGIALVPIVLGLPPMLGPIHIAFLEMVIDPVCTLVFEAETEERNLMKRPPRPANEPLFDRSVIVWAAVQGILVFLLVGGTLWLGHHRGMAETEIRALVFISLVLSILSLVFVNRSFSASLLVAFGRPNAALTAVLAIVALILSASLLSPAIAGLFRFGPLQIDDLAITAACGAAVLLILELLKPRLAPRL